MESANIPSTTDTTSENVNTINMNNTVEENLKPSTETPQVTVESLMSEIDIKLKDGLLDEAVELYGTIMELTIAKYEGDDLNPMLAENYARYGSLLLRLAIKNNDQNVLSSTNAATAGTAETTEALLKAASGDKKKLIEFSGDEDEENEEVSEKEAANENDPSQTEAPEEDEDDEDDFTIAWENLDVARLLFEKRIDGCTDETEKSSLNQALGSVYQDLGDLSLENENFSDAISEYEMALKCFGATTVETPLRNLAGIYFNLAMSMELEDRLDEAKNMYIQAKAFLQKKQSQLLSEAVSNGSVDEKDSVDESTPLNPQLTELKCLITEISLKIEDMDSNNNQASLSKELQEATNKAALAAAQSLNGTVNDLSGLVKKRKAEQPSEASTEKETKIETAADKNTEN